MQSPNAPLFHFPADIKLRTNPLAEAWLEIRWNLVPLKDSPDIRHDPDFKFALGAFQKSVKLDYGHVEPLPASHMPDEITAYAVRHRFRRSPDEWPLLQIGPGVASVNFLTYDRWETFEQEALYLREKLVSAYADIGAELTTKSVALRYRDAESFSHSNDNFLAFIHDHLNTTVRLPEFIPGAVGQKNYPSRADLKFTYDLRFPVGTGTIRISTGTRQKNLPDSNVSETEEVVLWQHEIVSQDDDAPAISAHEEFRAWLVNAHAVIHEWFFALIHGPLRDRYVREE